MWEQWDWEHWGLETVAVALCVTVVAAKLAILGRAAEAGGTEPSSAACDNPK